MLLWVMAGAGIGGKAHPKSLARSCPRSQLLAGMNPTTRTRNGHRMPRADKPIRSRP